MHIFKALITVYNCCKLHFIFLKLLVIIVVNQIRKARAEPTVFETPNIKNSHFTSLRAKRAAFFTACLNIHVNIPMRLFLLFVNTVTAHRGQVFLSGHILQTVINVWSKMIWTKTMFSYSVWWHGIRICGQNASSDFPSMPSYSSRCGACLAICHSIWKSPKNVFFEFYAKNVHIYTTLFNL